MDRPAAPPFRLRDLADAIGGTADEGRRLRLVFEFLRGAQEDGHPPALLVADEPAPTGDARFDAMLAAIAEDLAFHGGIDAPGWAEAQQRFLDRFWWVSDLPYARARALVHTPASYRRRGVMIERDDLVSV